MTRSSISISSRQGIHALSVRSLAMLAGVASSVAIARLGGPDLKGVSSAFAAANSLAFAFVAMDLGQQIVKATQGPSGQPRSRDLLLLASVGYVVVAIPFVAYGAAESSRLLWLAVGTVAYLIPSMVSVVALAHRGATIAAIGSLFQQVALLLIVVVLSLVGNLDGQTVLLAVTLSYLAPLPWFWHWTPAPIAPRTSAIRGMRQVLLSAREGLPWQVGRISQFALLRLDVLALAALAGSATTGIYSVGLSLSGLLGVVSQVKAGGVYHRASQGLRFSPLRACWRAALHTGIAALPLLVFAKPLIDLVYGSAFNEAFLALLVTLPGAILFGVVQVCTSYVRVHGGPSDLARFSLPAIAAMAILLMTLIPWDPILGAGLAYSVAVAVSALGGLMAVVRIDRRQLDVSSD